MKTKMTITKAMVEMKRLGERADMAIHEISRGTVKVAGKKKQVSQVFEGKPVSEAVETFKSNFDSPFGLIDRFEEIAAAVAESNAVTKVTIAGEEMTVAAAIKQKAMAGKKARLIDVLMSQVANVKSAVETENEKVQVAAERSASEIFGAKQKADSTMFAEHVNDYVSRNALDVVEGYDTLEVLAQKKLRLSAFLDEVDVALSVANATTYIEV